ncbi:MAG TPA: DNA polymerase III subunit alpha [Clostridiales bacterium]|nr:DNA polymerase III subunit alpha [Clostridiales bacterium]HCV69199.1 DNA polymerase III subunit alpha [Clostridiales bacterium]
MRISLLRALLFIRIPFFGALVKVEKRWYNRKEVDFVGGCAMSFTHLHLHTEYSLLDGACRIPKLVERIKALGMTSCAITDHGVMYGCIDFYSAMKDAGIKPIIGCEVYVCRDRLDKSAANREYSHLILLCENNTGYQNLMKLVSEGFLTGYYYRPRIDYNLIRQHSEGLICLSACLSGDLPKLLLQGRYDDAEAYVREMQDIFGEKNFYVEIMDHGIREEKIVMPRLISLAREMNVPLVATNDCHYLEEKDADAQEVLLCIQTGKTLDDANRMRMDTRQLYVKSEDEMRTLFAACPDAVDRTQEIADRCNVEFEFGVTRLPHYPVPEGETALSMLTRLTHEGLRERYPDAKETDEPWQRLNYELNVISSMGYVDYFLIVWDFIRYAKSQGIMVGPGRGSGAGSIVAYSLGITMLDPLKYQLLFERFLNPERVTMPDIDVDFCYERRQEVIDYVARKYGADHVSQIITFGTLQAKGCIRDVGRVLGMSYQDTDAVAKAIPFDLGMTLEKALTLSPLLKTMYDEQPEVHRLIDTAMTLEGMPRHASTHAAGVLITGKPVMEYVPLQRNDEVITTQYPMGTIERLGLLKMDFLGLRTLTVIRDTLDMLREQGIDMKPEDIPRDDPAVYEMISAGDTDGVFQLEGGGMRTFLTNMKPTCFEDIIAAISLYRPGPMESIPRYIQGKQNPSSIHYETEKLRPILDVTYGCMVYQEQVMQIVRDLAGYSYGRSDLVRRAMAKKKHKVMAQEREYFIHGKLNDDGTIDVPGCVRNGVPEEVASHLYDEMTAFASYAFNKSHAAAYAVVCIETAWLKRYHPVPFMAAILNSVYGNPAKIAAYIQYCRSRGIAILPPDVNRSQWKFTVAKAPDGQLGILFGLGAVKTVGQGAVDAIIRERKNGAYRDIFDFCRRIDTSECNKRVVESLIKAGAFDGMGGNRPQLLAVFESAMDANSSLRKQTVDGQISLFDMAFGGAPLVQENHTLPNLPDYPLRQRLALEKEIAGVYITGHPLDDYRDVLGKLPFSTADLDGLEEREDRGLSLDGQIVDMGGILTEVKGKATKKGAYMGFITLEDLTGQIECLVFPKVYERYQGMMAVDDLVVLHGRLSIREEEAPKLLVEKLIPLEAWHPEESAPAAPMGSSTARPVPPPKRHASEAPKLTDAQAAAKAPRKLYLRLNRPQMDAASSALSLYPGSVPVYLHLPAEKMTLLAPKTGWCDASDGCLNRLNALLGAENVKLLESR